MVKLPCKLPQVLGMHVSLVGLPKLHYKTFVSLWGSSNNLFFLLIFLKRNFFSYEIVCKTFYFVQNTSDVNSVHSCLIRDNNHIQVDVKGEKKSSSGLLYEGQRLIRFFMSALKALNPKGALNRHVLEVESSIHLTYVQFSQ